MFIFGQTLPQSSIQSDLVVNADIAFDGIPWVAFATTPYQQAGTTTGTSGWWESAYGSQPDIALNHPSRWTISLANTNPVTTQFLFNCPLGYTSTYSAPACAIESGVTPALTDCNASNENNVANDCAFYNMKGFFVTTNAGENANSASTSGQGAPSLTSATVGDSLTLRARVYNYSLTNMTADQTVYVQFYAQPVNNSGDFTNDTATFIGTAQFGGNLLPAPCGGATPANPQPCINGSSGDRNWVYAEVEWDTSTLPAGVKESDSYWYFWVVAWAKDSTGLVTEIADHSVTFSPPADPTQAVAGWTSFIEVPVEIYSNNVGFFGQLFMLLAPASTTALQAPGVADSLEVIDVSVVRGSPLRRRPNTVRATLLARGGTADFVLTRFTSHDRDDTGKLFDLNVIPRLQDGVGFNTVGVFQPDTCGLQEVVVEAIPYDSGLPTAVASNWVLVSTDPADDISVLKQTVRALDLKPRVQRSLMRKLGAASRQYRKGRNLLGDLWLTRFSHEIRRWSGTQIPTDTAFGLIDEADSIIHCAAFR